MSDNMNKGFDQAAAFKKLRALFHFLRPMSSVASQIRRFMERRQGGVCNENKRN
jgi:hypothetical protein